MLLAPIQKAIKIVSKIVNAVNKANFKLSLVQLISDEDIIGNTEVPALE